MNTQWQIKDLIDLEYFLHIDATRTIQSHRSGIEARDRDIYLNHIQPQIKETQSFPRRFVIKAWLRRRRQLEKNPAATGAILPGEAVAETFRLLGYGLFIVGALLGIGLALSLLTYTGAAPLNISVYLGLTVFAQILLLLLLGGLFLFRLIRPQLFYRSVIYSILSRLVTFLTSKFKERLITSLSGARREGMAMIFGMVRGKKQVYGSLFYWPVFISAQLFGIGFNLGVLSTTLLRVIGTDMAFGWQSTVQVGAGVVHAIVKWLAMPWSSVVPTQLAHPTLAQIEGSRLIIKDGIYHLTTPDLVAWWPFLCFAVLFYGLLPRLILFIVGWISQRYFLSKIELGHAACDQLVDRLTLPRVRFGAPEGSRPNAPPLAVPEKIPVAAENTITTKKFIVMIPDDIFDASPDRDLRSIVVATLGGSVVATIRINPADAGTPMVPEELISTDSDHDWTHVLILQEAWQPPIVEEITFLKALRRHLGDSTPLLIGLIGKPTPRTIFTPVSPINRQTWQKRLASLGDPYLRLEELCHENT